MKILSRDFSFREKVMLLILGIVLLALLYLYLVDIPVRDGIKEAEVNVESLQTEVDSMQIRLNNLREMDEQLELLSEDGTVGRMESYNNSKNEVAFINEIMERATDYKFSFGEVTLDGDQIRRPFVLEYTAKDYDTAMKILQDLENCQYRCIVGEVVCSGANNDSYVDNGIVQVSLTATFYETMVDGVQDLALPTEEESNEAE